MPVGEVTGLNRSTQITRVACRLRKYAHASFNFPREDSLGSNGGGVSGLDRQLQESVDINWLLRRELVDLHRDCYHDVLDIHAEGNAPDAVQHLILDDP